MKVWEGKQVVGFLLTWRLPRRQLQQETRQISTINLISVTLAPNQILLKWRPSRKIWSSASELKRTVLKVNCELWWIVKIDRQFCGTVYVISWTVALILSSRKFGTRVCIIPRLCWQNKELFCMKSGQIRQRRGIYLTQEFWHQEEFNIENLFIGELLLISENRTLHFSDSDIFVDGRNKENRASKLKINGIVSRSVIHLSGSTQWSEFWADLLKVSSSLETFQFLWWIVIIIGNNKLKIL